MGARNISAQLLCLTLAMLTSCSPVNRTASTNKSQASENALRPASVSPQELTMPSWCSLKQIGHQVCFRCERSDESMTIPYEQCFDALESFHPTTDCYFRDDITKTISCDGTSSGRTFLMDVSLAKEKVIAVVPPLTLAIELIAKNKFADNPQAKTFTKELSAFFSGRIEAIANGRDTEIIANDLILFVNRHTKTPMTAEQATHFKSIAVSALMQLSRELTGHKDYSLHQIILRLLAVARTIPDDLKGDIRPYLTGPGLAELLSEDRSQTLMQSFSILNPSIIGAKSADDLIAELIKAP